MDFGGGVTLDESLRLDLNGLGMLSTVTNSRQEYLDEMRIGRIRPLSCSSSPHRTDIATARSPNNPPTKENFQKPNWTTLCNDSVCHLSKILQRRSRKIRISPYCRRKPLNTIATSRSTTRSSSGTGSPTTSLSSDDGDRGSFGLTPITQLFQEHLSLQQTHMTTIHKLPINLNLKIQPCRSRSNAGESVSILGQDLNGLRLKTGSDCFQFPVLTRSKSLEDLRECIKPKTKSLSSYVCGCGGVSSFDVSLSPRFNRENASDVFISGRPQADFPQLPAPGPFGNEDSPNIRNEIDSMSMRIQKLDVA